MNEPRLNRKYSNLAGEILHVVTLNNGRFQVCNKDWDVVKHGLTASEVIETIPADYKPIGSWFNLEVM